MKTLIKSSNQNTTYWRYWCHISQEFTFVQNHNELAIALFRNRFDQVIIDFHSLDDSPLIEYLYHYYPDIKVILLVGKDMKAAINLLKSRSFEILERDSIQIDQTEQ
jgi:hypothetical protein